ncbi:MAG: two-component regulator propeller domain-containing protein, partial [Bacteroidota bacterium]
RSLYVDSRGTLWVGCGFPWMDNGDMGGGLNRFDPKTESFTRYLHQPGNANSLIDNRVRAIFEDSKGNFWVGTMGDGLHLMNREKGTFTRLRNRNNAVPAKPFLKDNPRNAFGQVTFVFEDNRGWLWIGSFDGGLNIFDPKTKEMKHFESDFGRRGGLQTDFIWNICQTKDGTIWLSSGTGGRMVFKIKTAPKVAVFQDLKSVETPKISVQAIAEDLTGKLWVGTAGGAGLLALDPKTGKTTNLANDPNPGNQNGNLNSQVVNNLATDKSGNLWVGVADALKKIDPKSGKTERILPKVFDGKVQVSRTLEDRHGNIWIATYGEGVVCYEPKTGRHQRFRIAEGLGGNFAMSLLEDRFGNIWVGGGKPDKVGSEPLFLSRFDSAAQVFRNFKFAPPGEFGCVVQMAEDEEGYLWFTTALNGIRRLDSVLGTFKKYTVSNSSLPSNDIRSLVIAPSGKIWMSAKDGLIEFDPATETFFPYDSQHGVTSATMIYGAGFLRRNGEVLFGSYGGFHKVLSEKTKPSPAV